MKFFSSAFSSALITIVASVVGGALAGAAAGWSFAQLPFEMSFVPPADPAATTTSTTESTSVGPTVEVIPIERKAVEPILPPAFLERRVSSIAGVYQRTPGEAVLSESALLGEAVAVTTDGWFVAPAAVVGNAKIADLVLWHDGVAATATRGIADDRASVVFLKTDFTNLPAPAFARYENAAPGISVWIERRAGSYEPAMIASLHGENGELKGTPSRIAARRPTVASLIYAGDAGAPVWDGNGTLLGLATGAVGGRLSFIPASAWAPSLYGIFSDGKILHADLGIRSAELSALRLIGMTHLPESGAWLVEDRAAKAPAVEEGSPAFVAGLREGDVITRVDRDILDGSADLGEVLVQYKPGSHVTLTVIRGTETRTVPVTLGSVQVSRELK